jgi:hypothetical protein
MAAHWPRNVKEATQDESLLVLTQFGWTPDTLIGLDGFDYPASVFDDLFKQT